MNRQVIVFSCIAAAFVAACATSPLGRRQIILVSGDQMSEMGVTAYRDMQKKTPATKDPKVSAYVNCVAHAITAEPGEDA